MRKNIKHIGLILLFMLSMTTAFGQNVVTRNRVCSVCKQSKPVSAFSGDSQKCKACVNKAHKKAEKERIAREQAEKESIKNAFELGHDYYLGRNGKTQDYAEAMKWYLKAAEQGHSNAQNQLGYMYQNGYGVPIDYSEALKWYRKAAEQGHPRAQNNLGIMYEKGYGVAKDFSQARYWYEKSAAQGHEKAKRNLSRLNNR